VSRGAGDLSTAFGRLYAANTIGAIVGAAAAGFLLIELLGLSGTLIVGAICSGAAGLIALGLDARARHAAAEEKTEALAIEPSTATQAAATPATVSPATESDPPRAASDDGSTLEPPASSRLVSGPRRSPTRSSGHGSSHRHRQLHYVFSLILVVFLVGLAPRAVGSTSSGRGSRA
jgi:hypothetical protein